MERKGKDDDFAKMIRFAFNISKFEVEQPNYKRHHEENRKRYISIHDVCS